MHEQLARAALILIDWQVGMDDPKWGHRNNPGAEANAARLLGIWRGAELPIYHVQHISREPDSVFGPERPGSAIKDLVRPAPGEPIIQKHVNSAFIGTDLEVRLRGDGIQAVVLTGMQTDHCVSTTARMAGNLGFTTYVVADATATFDRAGAGATRHPAEQVHEINLASLRGEFANIVETEEVAGAVAAGTKRPAPASR